MVIFEVDNLLAWRRNHKKRWQDVYSCSQLNFAVCNYRKKKLRPRKVHTLNFWDDDADDAVKILLFSEYSSLDLDIYVCCGSIPFFFCQCPSPRHYTTWPTFSWFSPFFMGRTYKSTFLKTFSSPRRCPRSSWYAPSWATFPNTINSYKLSNCSYQI